MAKKGNTMLRFMIAAVLALGVHAAHAAQAGKVIFTAGHAQAGERALVLDAPVNEGELLRTGADGYIYIKTLDSGLFILRPNTTARIATYRIDAKNPANTRIKLELLSGVARSQSGSAVKLARQNFRFNTPVAAIGVRGTDFTVFTSSEVSRVAVISGGITVSGFAGACRPEGTGPCESPASRELSAAQKGQLLQIHRGHAAAQLLPAAGLSPDVVAPPGPNENKTASGIGANLATPMPLLDPLRAADVNRRVEAAQPAPALPGPIDLPVPPPVVAPPTEVPPVPVPPVGTPPVTGPAVPDGSAPGVLERKIVWGRFQPILDQQASVNLPEQAAAGAQLLGLKGKYALLRTAGSDYLTPERGSLGLALKDGEAYISSSNVTVAPVKAALENGVLNFNFDKKTFSTSFDLVSNGERFNMAANGMVAADGRFGVISQYAPGNNMSADGVLSSENGGSAAYLFIGNLSGDRTANGVTYWGRPPN